MKRKAIATIACALLVVTLAACADCFATRPVPSIKRQAAVAAPPARAAAPQPSIVERAKTEQANRCGQRHIERASGTLNETADEKRDRDDQCVELHRHDYVK
jgi:hypothetical protein